MPRSALRRPIFWLIVQPVTILAFLTATGQMKVRTEPDTQSYRGVDFSSWSTAVRGSRPLGYPLLLRAVGAWSPSFAAMPYVQFVLYAAAVVMLFAGLREFGFAELPALAAASTLFYSGFALYYSAVLLPDTPALALAVIAVGCLAAVVGRGGALAWAGLTLSLALAYHFRAAYLFLVPLAPVLGLVLKWLAPLGGRSQPNLAASHRGRWRSLAARLAAASAAPLLAFCGLMWATVGHFGLVSFGGFNVLGIAAQLLSPELADELPSHLQPLAHEMLRIENQVPGWKPPSGYYNRYDNYDLAIYHVAKPAARSIYGDDEQLANQRLAELARAILLARPFDYLRWLLPAAKHGVTQLFEYSFLDRPGLTLLVILALCQSALIARWRRGRSAAPPGRGDYVLEYHATITIALAFAAAKLMLIILVERPIYRYVAPASIFFLMWLAVAVVDQITRLCGRSTSAAA